MGSGSCQCLKVWAWKLIQHHFPCILPYFSVEGVSKNLWPSLICRGIKEKTGEQNAVVSNSQGDQPSDFPRTGGFPGTFGTKTRTILGKYSQLVILPTQTHFWFTLTLKDTTSSSHFCILVSYYRRFVFMRVAVQECNSGNNSLKLRLENKFIYK